VWYRRKSITRLLALYHPDLSLLRNKIQSSLQSRVFTPDTEDRQGIVDTWACELVMRDNYGSTRKETYQAAILLDLVRDAEDERFVRLEQAENVQGLCAPSTMPPMVSRALDISFLGNTDTYAPEDPEFALSQISLCL